MPPCLDVYVWVASMDPDKWGFFLDGYVSPDQPREHRWPAFRRKFIEGTGMPADDVAVAELAVEGNSSVTIYLRGVDHYGASITITRDEATVLGVSLDDALGERDVQDAWGVLDDLRREMGATEGVMGVELPPPRDRLEWDSAKS